MADTSRLTTNTGSSFWGAIDRARSSTTPQNFQPPQVGSPTFSDLQQKGQARPAPPGAVAQTTEQDLYSRWRNYRPYAPPQQISQQFAQRAGAYQPVPGFTYTQSSPIQSALGGQVLSALQRPSAYDSNVVRGTYDMLNRRLSEDYDIEARKIDEEMARRGIYDSSTAGGRYGDLRTQQSRAQADLVQGLLDTQARTYQNDRASAIAQALGYGDQQYGQQLGAYQANLAGNAQNYQQQMGLDQLWSDQLNREYMQGLQSGAQSFGEEQALLNDYLGFGQQAFQNQLQAANFNRLLDQDYMQLLMQMMGYTG